MVDKYTKVVLTIIAVGLWVQVGLQLNPVGSAAAEWDMMDSNLLIKAEKNLGQILSFTMEVENHLYEIKEQLLKN